MSSIKNFIEDLKNYLINIGIDASLISVNHSSTSFGNSSYLYVGRFKIRHSDHSTGIYRILEELNVSNFNRKSVIETVERFYFPERFEEVVTLEFGNSFETTEKDVKKRIELGFEVEILEELGVSKSGNKKFKIRVKNDKKTTFKRK